jgi:diguanylate cyclase (GGDEF)-like protein
MAEWAEAALLLTRIAEIDLQTGLASRNHTLDVLEAEFERAASYPNYSLSLVAFDVDEFKAVNDRNGHAAGDEVIERIARIMEQHHLKERGDVSGRTGKGDEFLFILPMVTKREAIQFAEEVKRDIAEQTFTSGWRKFKVTASFGVATYRESYQDYHKLMDAADRALYRSKERGRNRVSASR